MRTIVVLMAAMSLGAGCAMTAPQFRQPRTEASLSLRRAIVEPADIERAITTKGRIEKLRKTPPALGEPWFESRSGTQQVIVSAPHATKPFRDGKYRFSDGPGTAALAQSLHTICGVSVINTIRDSPSDPNYYDDNDYKRELARLIAEQRPALVLDIHGSHPSRPYDVDFGTMDGAYLLGQEELVASLAAHLREEGLTNLSDNRFAASENDTITKFASRLHVPAIQLEISATWLEPSRGCDAANPSICGGLGSHRFAQLLQGLIRYLEDRGQCARERKSSGDDP